VLAKITSGNEMILLVITIAGLLLLLCIVALLVDIRAVLRKIELSTTNLDHDFHELNKEELQRRKTYDYERSHPKAF
jgi:predicted Holliday junction resolvase-like endonuclease